MKGIKLFCPAFIRALLFKTPAEQLNPGKNPRLSKNREREKRLELLDRLEEAESYTNTPPLPGC